jgi:ssDNA-binding Zn-finger/Zn-ribbon topoisomerase 1
MYSELLVRLHKQAEADKLSEPEKFMCSVCGAEMIRRKSKFNNGYWWGCSNFPRCRNTFKE